jgi:hypothetical protein
MVKVISSLVAGALLILTATNELAAEDKYRKTLKRYWQKTLREEGLSPLFYASTVHAPRTVWVKDGQVLDFFSSGQDLFPASRVPLQVAEIELPDFKGNREFKVSLGLQLAGVRELGDASLDALIGSDTEWGIELGEAEIHFIGKRDARRTIKTLTGETLTEYIADTLPGESLQVIVKAVFVRGVRVEVRGSSGQAIEANAEAAEVLEGLGFGFDRSKRVWYSLEGKDMYYAAGFRSLTKDGLKSAVEGDETTEPLLLEVGDAPSLDW